MPTTTSDLVISFEKDNVIYEPASRRVQKGSNVQLINLRSRSLTISFSPFDQGSVTIPKRGGSVILPVREDIRLGEYNFRLPGKTERGGIVELSGSIDVVEDGPGPEE